MNKTLPFALLMLFLMSQKAWEQNRFAIKATSVWRVDSLLIGIKLESFEKTKYHIEGDTSISSVKYFKLYKSGVAYFGQPVYYKYVYVGAIRDNDNKIYFIKKNKISEEKLYDFNLKPGDTIKSIINKSHIIESVDTLLDGRKIFELALSRSFIVEGIGGSCGLLRNAVPWHAGIAGSFLICYSENSELVFQTRDST